MSRYQPIEKSAEQPKRSNIAFVGKTAEQPKRSDVAIARKTV